MRRLSKKEALVYREYKNNLETAMCYILGKGLHTEKVEYADIKISAKEVRSILDSLISEGFLYKDMTILSILKINGELIRLLDNPTEEEQMMALRSRGNSAVNHIADPCMEAKKYIVAHQPMYSKWEWFQDLPDEELKLLMDEVPDIATLLPENRWTQYLVTEYLRKMVTSGRRELIDDYQHRVRIPENLRDKIFYRSFCMVEGYNYSKIPVEKREEYVTEKLAKYTLDETNSYTSALWMYQYLPEAIKTEDISLKCCLKHPGCFTFLPECLKTREFLKKCIAQGQKNIPVSMMHLLSEDEILEVIGNAGGYYCPDIPQTIMTEKIAYALTRYISATKTVPKKFRTKEWYKMYVSHTGYLKEVPDSFIDEEMCIEAIRGNYLAARENVPDSCITQQFLEVEAEELRFSRLKDIGVPHTAELLNKYAYHKPYNLNEIPEEERMLVTDDTLVRIIRDNERHWDSVLKFRENDTIIKALLEMTDPNRNGEIKNRFYVVSQFSKVPEEVIDEFIPKKADAIMLKGITRKQMEKSVSYFPENVLYLPDEWIEEVKRESTEETENDPKPFDKIMADTKYEQMSIWDILNS